MQEIIQAEVWQRFQLMLMAAFNRTASLCSIMAKALIKIGRRHRMCIQLCFPRKEIIFLCLILAWIK